MDSLLLKLFWDEDRKKNCTFFLPFPEEAQLCPPTPLHARPAHKSRAPFTWWPPASAAARAQERHGLVKQEVITPTLPSPVCPLGKTPTGETGTRLSGSIWLNGSWLHLSQLPSASLWSCSQDRCGIYLLRQSLSACFRAKAKAYQAWKTATISASMTAHSQMSLPNWCMALNIAGSSSAALLSSRHWAIRSGICFQLGKGSIAVFLWAPIQLKVESEHMAALWTVTVQNKKEIKNLIWD